MSVNVSGGGGVTRHCGHTKMLSFQSLTNITTTVQVFAAVSHNGLGE